MSSNHTGNIQPNIDNEEHDHGNDIATKKVLAYGYDTSTSTKRRLHVDPDGDLQVDIGSSALPTGAATSTNQTSGLQKTQIVDSGGAELEMVKQNDNFNAANHGIVILGLDDSVSPNKYKQMRVDSDGEFHVHIENAAHADINPATEETLTKSLGLSGTLSDTSVTMTNATTAYQLPASAPTAAYTLVVYNTSTTATIYVRFTTGTTLGIPVAPGGTFSVDLGANKAIFAYSATAGVVVNCTYGVK